MEDENEKDGKGLKFGENKIKGYLGMMEDCSRIRLRPRYLRDVSMVDTRTTIQGQEIQAPICISPTAFHSIAWPDGERSTARAAPRGLRWFQLYVQSDWELNKQLIRRVEALGFKALVITVDVPVGAKRRQDIRNQLNLVANLMRMDLRSPEERSSTLPAPTSLPSTSFCWNDLSSIQSITRLPIILKGILTKEDAELAVKHNVQGIIVSNHGGRQLDEVPASIDALTEVVAAVKGRVEVYMDGGVRTGNDVLKALALGAKCIFLGRPILWGLTYKSGDLSSGGGGPCGGRQLALGAASPRQRQLLVSEQWWQAMWQQAVGPRQRRRLVPKQWLVPGRETYGRRADDRDMDRHDMQGLLGTTTNRLLRVETLSEDSTGERSVSMLTYVVTGRLSSLNVIE
ncbi:Hydroxyacid oxidase 2 [Microtus ochrogaster]|uniref:Hydroxyacid oxidase 2 n=1 Tax=Microtus ochrogaster TaxID=79684 RepID=A0A8J6GC06_MICOH|nr:Hydroxyacid oxidase 2 [Microtus ochrogaster]